MFANTSFCNLAVRTIQHALAETHYTEAASVYMADSHSKQHNVTQV